MRSAWGRWHRWGRGEPRSARCLLPWTPPAFQPGASNLHPPRLPLPVCPGPRTPPTRAGRLPRSRPGGARARVGVWGQVHHWLHRCRRPEHSRGARQGCCWPRLMRPGPPPAPARGAPLMPLLHRPPLPSPRRRAYDTVTSASGQTWDQAQRTARDQWERTKGKTGEVRGGWGAQGALRALRLLQLGGSRTLWGGGRRGLLPVTHDRPVARSR